MKKTILFIFLFAAIGCFGQQDMQLKKDSVSNLREKRAAFNVGVFMGGGGWIGGDFEYLAVKHIGVQIGAGVDWWGLGVNYHFKPYINSPFISLQYNRLGFRPHNVASTINWMFVFRLKKIFQAGAGCGVVMSKGPQWSTIFDDNVMMLLNFNIGVYFHSW